jgi:DNA-binding CsgD family transcriptional regulator
MPPRNATATREDDESAVAVAVCAADDATCQRLAALLAQGRIRVVGSASDPEALQALLAKTPSDTLLLLSREQLDALLRSDPGASVTDPVARDDAALTPRELDVLAALADGAPNKMIARRLGISFHTVKFHVASILDKLDADSRTEAVAEAARRGLVML